MREAKVIFIIPGFGHRSTKPEYQKIARILKKQGYRPILVSIPWKKTTISENTEYFLEEFNKISSKNKYILGFSYGAMIAFIAATKVEVEGLMLCSLSPYFGEDLPKIGKNWTSAMLTRYQDFAGLQCSALAKQIKAKQIHLFYGTDEAKSLINRVKQAYDQISINYKYLIPIDKTDHDIGSKKYISKIRETTKLFN